MRSIILSFLCLTATLALAGEIIPVSTWPCVLNLPDKQVVNPGVDQCIKAGYRLLTVKPATPAGERITTESIIQDPNDASRCKYSITYEAIPVVTRPVIIPEVLTNVPAAKVSFSFTTNGQYRSVTWLDAPKTNGIK